MGKRLHKFILPLIFIVLISSANAVLVVPEKQDSIKEIINPVFFADGIPSIYGPVATKIVFGNTYPVNITIRNYGNTSLKDITVFFYETPYCKYISSSFCKKVLIEKWSVESIAANSTYSTTINWTPLKYWPLEKMTPIGSLREVVFTASNDSDPLNNKRFSYQNVEYPIHILGHSIYPKGIPLVGEPVELFFGAEVDGVLPVHEMTLLAYSEENNENQLIGFSVEEGIVETGTTKVYSGMWTPRAEGEAVIKVIKYATNLPFVFSETSVRKINVFNPISAEFTSTTQEGTKEKLKFDFELPSESFGIQSALIDGNTTIKLPDSSEIKLRLFNEDFIENSGLLTEYQKAQIQPVMAIRSDVSNNEQFIDNIHMYYLGYREVSWQSEKVFATPSGRIFVPHEKLGNLTIFLCEDWGNNECLTEWIQRDDIFLDLDDTYQDVWFYASLEFDGIEAFAVGEKLN